MATRVLLAGGTGLVGGHLTEHLLAHPGILLDSLVRAPRRESERPVDFDALAVDPMAAGSSTVDVGISCLGTTLRRAGSQTAFRKVDHDLVVAFAKAAKARGATRFIVVSSVDAGGRSFYLRVKGETETDLRSLGFERLDLVRPSLLLGPRSERRVAEGVAQALAPLATPLLRGGLAKYAALDAEVVASAIARLVSASAPGVHIHQVPELRALASQRASGANLAAHRGVPVAATGGTVSPPGIAPGPGR